MFNLQDSQNRREPQRLDLSIVPGKSLGWFRLGTSIWDINNFIREQSRIIPSVDLKYDEEAPISTDIFLSLTANGIHMRFDSASQRLKSIQVSDFSKLRLTYHDSEVSSIKVTPTFLSIYKIFGPTYPGELDSKKKEYTLNYPGISFVFPIPEEHISFYTSSSGMTDLPMELPDGTSPLLSRLYTFHGSSFQNAIAPPLHRSKNSDGIGGGLIEFGEFESVVAELKRGIIVNFLNNVSTEIVLNVTTPQDLLVDLGSPLRIFYKEEDKMRIHSEYSSANDTVESGENGNLNSSPNVEDCSRGGDAIDYFYNYFHLGFDVLFDGSTHRCKKIVLHGNVPGHFDFQRYKRCPYKILLPKVSSNSQISNEVARLEVLEDDDNQSTSQSPQTVDNIVTSEMKMDQIRKLLGNPSGQPLIFNRGAGGQNPFGPTKLSGYDGVVFEEMKNGCVATITLF
ncbi:2419_t:CDS:10 [Funneliformis geosporum]|uniref:1877_t:CDS:1 n=1 Tax=Funneliformis geosporum TaxID=1117311 RepID=A0A9W4WLP0_9GLOM|nr:2419_t:CDS:10 [Funneliformis geosporum]CAI2171303.1 1877_t:CDS:10 [Funneliformis geosporum]